VERAVGCCGRPRAFGVPHGVGVHRTLRPAHELHVPGGRDTGAYQHLRLEEYDHQVSAKIRLIKDIQKRNCELLQENHCQEAHVKELNDELMRTYHSRDV
jgi:hypothetical protein